MKTITKNDFNKSIVYFYIKQKMLFFAKNVKFIKSIEIEHYYKKISRLRRKFFSEFYYLFLKIESITGNLPLFKTMSIKILYKKRVKRRGYFIINSNILENFYSFIEFYLINNAYRNVNLLKRTRKKYRYLQQLSKKKFIKKIFFNKNFIKFRMEYNFCNLCFKRIKKAKKFFRHFKKRRFRRSLILSVKINSKFSNYFFNLLSTISLNNYKIILFIYKYYRKKIKK